MTVKIPVSHPTLCGSIAGSIGGMGVKMHNAAFQHLNLPYTYVSFEPTDVQAAINAMRGMGIRGLAVTMPFKEVVIPLLDCLDDTASEIGAVNTIVNDNGILTGYNTDAYGFITALQEQLDPTGKRIAVMGAGGVAKTIVWALKRYTSDIVLYNRSGERGEDVASRFDIDFGGEPGNLKSVSGYDILVNATSVGFKSEQTLLKRDRIVPGSVVVDVVFIPVESMLVREAREAGCICVPGVDMLMYQACRQFELYTKQPAPADVYAATMKKIVSERYRPNGHNTPLTAVD